MLFALHETPGIGKLTEAGIMKTGKLAGLQDMQEPELVKLGLTARQAAELARMLEPAEIDRRFAAYDALGARVLAIWDREYPPVLRECGDAPYVLYALGRLELLRKPAVAIVGTRVPTAYGRHVAESLAESLAKRGFAVVSGLARGVDTRAHEGALRGGGTIAVLGTPIDRAYPPENASLYRDIARRGLLLSEYPLGTAGHPGLFPLRNRIIAGMSYGTVVVEAANRSGSLITAKLAGDYGREVYAVPGPVNSPKSEGTNTLIRMQAAMLIRSADDIYEDLFASVGGSAYGAGPPTEPDVLTSDEESVLRLLQDRPHTADELMDALAVSFGHLQAVLINLTIKHRVEQHPGQLYSAAARL